MVPRGRLKVVQDFVVQPVFSQACPKIRFFRESIWTAHEVFADVFSPLSLPGTIGKKYLRDLMGFQPLRESDHDEIESRKNG